ncbi:hypothetical protein LXA43DRAFT_1094786 [Ganoderma leucocontextum]|nr:hypothetical protein LXA43DRAFT_1094786 [Ganoderma leucocontextum]
MSANSAHEFPAPVGGVPDALDLAPSILFAVLYASIVPVVIWRMTHPQSRNTVLIATSFFSVERLVAFSLRAKAATSAEFRASPGLETYLQATYGGGFIAIGQDLANLLRALLVASTLGGDMIARHKLTPYHVRKAKAQTESDIIELTARGASAEKLDEGRDDSEIDVDGGDPATGNEIVDQAQLRQRIRKWCVVAMILFQLGAVLSATAGGMYKNALNGRDGTLVRSLWYASTVVGVVLLVSMALTALCACYKLPRVPRSSALLIVIVACLLSVVGIYRVTAISHSTTSLSEDASSAQNSAGPKAAFYVLEAAPEFLSIAILVSLNARRVFGTGPWGDLRRRDPKPKPKPSPEVESGRTGEDATDV